MDIRKEAKECQVCAGYLRKSVPANNTAAFNRHIAEVRKHFDKEHGGANSSVKVLASQNTDGGFNGTMLIAKLSHPNLDPKKAWDAAFRDVASRMDMVTGDAPPEDVRDLLDSKAGRHYADQVIARLSKSDPDYEEAVDAASNAVGPKHWGWSGHRWGDKGYAYESLKGKLASASAPAKRSGGRGRNDAGMRSRGNATPSVTIRKR